MNFEGTVGKGLYGDIGLDDIDISTPGKCPNPLDCNFDSGLCGFSNTLLGDDFDWTVRRGATPSGNTGPKFDHTQKNAKGGIIFNSHIYGLFIYRPYNNYYYYYHFKCYIHNSSKVFFF